MEKFEDVSNLDDEENNEVLVTPPLETLATLTFNERTKWTNAEPAKMLIEYGKHCPLGIDELHKAGLNGSGVNVAIIDKPLAQNHPEYENKIIKYINLCDGENISSLHGPAVASLLVGNTTGVAPAAKVIYVAAPIWKLDAAYATAALDEIIKLNKELPEGEKIKFVSVSAAFGDKGIFKKNSKLWNKKVEEAQKGGLCVVECTEGNRFVAPGYVDFETKEFVYGFPDLRMRNKQVGEVHVPNSLRTVAESYDNKNFSYAYFGSGGLSWGIPYAVGVLCLGQQANPELSAFELKDILIETAQANESIVDPKAFIKKVRESSRGLGRE